MNKLFRSLMIVAMTAMTFTACQDVPAPYEIPGTGDNEVKKEELGTVEKPLTVSEALALINSYKDGGVSSAEAVVKGKVVSVGYLDTENKTLSFYISEDGTATSQIQCYSCKGVNGAGIESKDYLKVGSVVVVKGILKKFVNKSGVANPELDAGCEIISITEGEQQESKSTLESPLTVSKAIAAGSGNEYVKGFIVGSVEGQKIAEGAHFSTESAAETNIILAASADETDVTKCMAVQLPSGSDIRTKLNLKNNPSNYKKEVILYGSLEVYFGQPGMKSTSFAVLDGVEIGKKPGSSEDLGDLAFDFKTNGFGQWTIDDKNKPSGVNAIWVHDSKYGLKATAYASSKNYASESWVISPVLDLSKLSSATLKIHHAINYFTSVDVAKTEVGVMASDDGGNTWAPLTIEGWPSKLSWDYFDSTADMSSYAGKNNVKLAFKYTSTDTKAGTWEIDKISIE